MVQMQSTVMERQTAEYNQRCNAYLEIVFKECSFDTWYCCLPLNALLQCYIDIDPCLNFCSLVMQKKVNFVYEGIEKIVGVGNEIYNVNFNHLFGLEFS